MDFAVESVDIDLDDLVKKNENVTNEVGSAPRKVSKSGSRKLSAFRSRISKSEDANRRERISLFQVANVSSEGQFSQSRNNSSSAGQSGEFVLRSSRTVDPIDAVRRIRQGSIDQTNPVPVSSSDPVTEQEQLQQFTIIRRSSNIDHTTPNNKEGRTRPRSLITSELIKKFEVLAIHDFNASKVGNSDDTSIDLDTKDTSMSQDQCMRLSEESDKSELVRVAQKPSQENEVNPTPPMKGARSNQSTAKEAGSSQSTVGAGGSSQSTVKVAGSSKSTVKESQFNQTPLKYNEEIPNQRRGFDQELKDSSKIDLNGRIDSIQKEELERPTQGVWNLIPSAKSPAAIVPYNDILEFPEPSTERNKQTKWQRGRSNSTAATDEHTNEKRDGNTPSLGSVKISSPGYYRTESITSPTRTGSEVDRIPSWREGIQRAPTWRDEIEMRKKTKSYVVAHKVEQPIRLGNVPDWKRQLSEKAKIKKQTSFADRDSENKSVKTTSSSSSEWLLEIDQIRRQKSETSDLSKNFPDELPEWLKLAEERSRNSGMTVSELN